MYLKSLELQGFKSFPDRTVIRFSDGLTAIVGPNGSGKSNISDAVRWVLGEQSTKSLRGEKMEDVIFGGTAKRGKMGFAQVTLILDNSAGLFPVDAAEVMVSRRFYRSGESEYTINRKRARLRDVRELFMDTGLGRDGYSVIGQGRIDEILSVKSVDRREVFEEAAGITKFRTRKGEAEKRLEQTDANLVRIRDIWNELNERSGPLQRQAETARQYLLLHDELRTYEVSLWMDALDGMKDALDKGEETLRTAQADLERVRAEQEQRYRQIEQLEQAIMQAEIQNEQLRDERSRLEQEQAGRARRTAVLEESCKNAAENIVQAQQQIASQTEQKQTIIDQRKTRQSRLNELEREIERVQRAQADKASALEQTARRIGEDQKKLEELRQTAERYAESVFQLEKEQTAVRTQLETMQRRQGSLDEEIAQAQAQAETTRAEQQAMQRQCVGAEEDAAVQEELLAEETARARQAADALQAARKKHGELHSSLLDSRNRIRMLTELQRDYEGFSRAVRLVMNRAGSGQLTGVHGPVSSLIQVDDRYVTAIEVALGAAASNIIVDTPEDAKRAIGLLKRSDGGRATFLPVDTIRPMRLSERGLERLDGFCGIASGLVSCDSAYRNIVENLLGRTVVMDNLDCALPAARQYRNRFRIVTRDGQIINAGGSLTGGSTGRSSGILSRANQLSALKQKEARQSAELAELEQRGHALAAQAQEYEDTVRDVTEQLSASRQKLAAQQAAARQHQVLLDSMEQTLSQLLAERDDADCVREGFEKKIHTLTRQAEEAADGKRQAEQRAAQAERFGQEVSDRLRELSDEAAQLRTELVQAQTERDAHLQALHDLQALLIGAEQTAQDARRRIEEYTRQQEAGRHELEQLRQQSGGYARQRQQLEQRLQDGMQRKERLEANKTGQNKQAQAVSDQMVSLERETARAEAAAEKIRSEEKQLLDRLWDSYELTPTAARPVARPVENRSEMEKKAGALRGEIRKLGPVNLAAMEEYDRLSERLAFLTAQKEDLEQAERELRGVIAELTDRMKDVFTQSFAQLNQYFGETFREMFGGGSAELRLEDENDVLGCGIEIRVTPPGKTVRSLSLLSGGEKAFVAIALYFAIMKVRPTPFCILDEIEAALDDVNVVRYAKYLRRLTDKTQFIVITHRRGTMEEADVLYGVTMQERGVSRLLMLNIREVEERLGLEIQ